NGASHWETVWVDDTALTFDVPPGYPVAAFTTDVSQGYAPLIVQFDGSSSHESNGLTGSIIYYMWDFGDGSQPLNISSPITDHTFSDPGTFTVKLTVFDTNNLKSTSSSSTIVANSLQSLNLPIIIGAGVLGLLAAFLVFRARHKSARNRARIGK